MQTIGTPLSATATRVMLLGGGKLGKEVILALQRLGVETIAVDRYADAPGHQVAHRAHVINRADGDTLRTLIKRKKLDLIVPEIEAIDAKRLALIEAEGLSRVIFAARTANLTMNREGIHHLASGTLNLPTSPRRFADSLDEMCEAISYIGLPCIIKPVMSSSGKGQSNNHGKNPPLIMKHTLIVPSPPFPLSRRARDTVRRFSSFTLRSIPWRVWMPHGIMPLKVAG